MMSIRSLADFNRSSLGGDGDWLTPPPSPPRPQTPGRHDERGMGTFNWPPARTSTWPYTGTFSWPRTMPQHGGCEATQRESAGATDAVSDHTPRAGASPRQPEGAGSHPATREPGDYYSVITQSPARLALTDVAACVADTPWTGGAVRDGGRHRRSPCSTVAGLDGLLAPSRTTVV